MESFYSSIENFLTGKMFDEIFPFSNKTKDQLWSLNAAQPVGNLMFK